MQSRAEKERVITEAKKQEYVGYYWYIRVRYKLQEFAAGHPGEWVPVIPLEPDPEETRHYAHMLLELFRASAVPTMELSVEITTQRTLEQAGVPWYKYGENLMLDQICYACGCVEQVYWQMAGLSWLCTNCAANYEGSV